jgi:predicted LPLAT superfamily acyltransferase
LHTWKLQWTFGQCLVDRAAAGIRNDFSFAANARHILDAALAREHGIILLAAHTGCWQTAHHALLEYVGLPVTVLGHHDEQDIDKDIAEHRGENPSHAFVGRDDGHLGPVKLVALLRRGEILCTTGDRIIENDKSVLTADFLGGKIRISCLPFRLASATGAPVVVAFARRAGPGRGEMDFVKAVNVPEGLGGASEKYRPYVGDYVSELEKFVLNHPYQFFNFYNLWE